MTNSLAPSHMMKSYESLWLLHVFAYVAVMLQWPAFPATPMRRSDEECSLLPEDPPSPPTRRWTLGATKHAAVWGRPVLEPIENSVKASSRRASDELCLVSLSGSRHSSTVCLPPLDVDASDLDEGRRIKGCRGASEYLERQHPESGLSQHEQLFVKESFQRFKSSSAEINCSDLFDVLNHLGFLGITDEAATSLAKEVSRFSTLDWKELLRVVESAGPWEYQQLQLVFQAHATVLEDDLAFVHAARLPFLLHELGATSEWEAIRESIVEAVGLDIPQQPPFPSEIEDSERRKFFFSFEQINRILASHRAAQGFTSVLLKHAETLFLSVARSVNGRPEVSIQKVPELLHRLHECNVSESVRETCSLESMSNLKRCMKKIHHCFFLLFKCCSVVPKQSITRTPPSKSQTWISKHLGILGHVP